MKRKNIALIGFMGVGKTLVSKRLGKDLDREIVSTDDEIVRIEGVPITDIFAKKGEPYFRLLEKRVVKEVCGWKEIIIDCGGGVVLDDENFEVLAENCYMIYLEATPETIYANISHKKDRPLLNVDDPKSAIGKLLKEREPFYKKCEFTVDGNNKSIDQMADDVFKLINKLEEK